MARKSPASILFNPLMVGAAAAIVALGAFLLFREVPADGEAGLAPAPPAAKSPAENPMQLENKEAQ